MSNSQGVLYLRTVNIQLDREWFDIDDKNDVGKYIGEIENGLPNGHGTETLVYGRTYEGKWKNGDRNGKGTETWTDGRKYTGQW